MNIPDTEVNLVNGMGVDDRPKSFMIEYVDLDQRPSLGTYVFKEDNPWYLDWPAIAKDQLSGGFLKGGADSYCDVDPTIDSSIPDYEQICTDLGGELINTNYGNINFSPDCDVRSIQTLISGSAKSNAYEYYDENLQYYKYYESASPTQVQFYYYPRVDGGLFEDRGFYGGVSQPSNFVKNESKWYVAFLDFGDGTDPIYTTSPGKLHNGKYITHTYRKPGIYNVTGWMFRVATNGLVDNVNEDTVKGVSAHRRFRTIVNLHPNPYHEDEFEEVGGSNYTFIPSRFTTPMVGGISPNSVYAKTLKRKLGYSGYTSAAKVKYQLQSGTYREQLDAEYALARINENLVGSEISKFTGSYAHETNINGSYPIEVSSSIEEYGTGNLYYSYQQSGIISGSNIDADGSIIYDDDEPPVLIHKGWFTGYGELGNDLGNADVGQVRYFQHPMSMWEMLGFSPPAGEFDSDIGWNLLANGTFSTGDFYSWTPSNSCGFANDNPDPYVEWDAEREEYVSIIQTTDGTNHTAIYKLADNKVSTITGEDYILNVTYSRSGDNPPNSSISFHYETWDCGDGVDHLSLAECEASDCEEDSCSSGGTWWDPGHDNLSLPYTDGEWVDTDLAFTATYDNEIMRIKITYGDCYCGDWEGDCGGTGIVMDDGLGCDKQGSAEVVCNVGEELSSCSGADGCQYGNYGGAYSSPPTLKIASISLRHVTAGEEYPTAEEAEAAYENLHPGTPSSQRYWKNIKPAPYELWEREGITMDSQMPGKIISVDTGSSQQWLGTSTELPNSSSPINFPINNV